MLEATKYIDWETGKSVRWSPMKENGPWIREDPFFEQASLEQILARFGTFLKDKERETIILRSNGLTIAETARRLKVSAGTAKFYQSCAIWKIAKVIKIEYKIR